MKNTDDKKSFEEILPQISSTLQYEFEGGLTSKRVIVFAVKKFGLKKTEDPVFNLELNEAVSLSAVYEALFQKRWARYKTYNPISIIQRALNKEEESEYIKVTFSKQGTISYCSFVLNEEKWVASGRLTKKFFEAGTRDSKEQNQEQSQEQKEPLKERLTPEQIQDEKDKLAQKLGYKDDAERQQKQKKN